MKSLLWVGRRLILEKEMAQALCLKHIKLLRKMYCQRDKNILSMTGDIK